MVSQDTSVAEPIVVPQEHTAEKADLKVKPKRQPPYSVVVYNDDCHTWQYVIDVLQRVCGYPLERCFQLTSQVHYSGRAHVWTGTLELAELKRDQIRGFGSDFYAEKTVTFPLGVSIEPLPGD